METKKCVICHTTIYKPPSYSKADWKKRRKYCSRKCKGFAQKTIYKGKLNPCYRGGKTITPKGYVETLIPEHPHANNRGYVYEHRLVMEKQLGRLLDAKEVVHHINKNPSDNRPENLELFKTGGSHVKHEMAGIPRPNRRGISLSSEHKHHISMGLKRFHKHHATGS